VFDFDDEYRKSLDRHDTGYVCDKCGYEPTRRELNRGICPGCREDRLREEALKQENKQ